jgi:hypothetical protein
LRSMALAQSMVFPILHIEQTRNVNGIIGIYMSSTIFL